MARMDARRWQQVQDLFEAALGRPANERRGFLVDRCLPDISLLYEVDSLLKADSSEHGLEPAWPVDQFSDDGLTPSRVGRFRVLRRIGRGGTAEVFLAHDEERGGEPVAVKVVDHAATSAALRKRLAQERAILGELDHPNVVRLLEVGTTEDEQPFLVLEYFAGEPIDQHADGNRLSLARRARLWEPICSAVGHAHQRGVVHRDLKPGNILVSESGEVRLLDFGIAKLLADWPGLEAATTKVGTHLMTVDYAAPEQVEGRAISPATDVYALGVVLYRLAAGRLPFDGLGPTLLDKLRAICSAPPPMPSEALAALSGEERRQIAAARSADPGTLERQLVRAIDPICRKAMAKRPGDRYPTPAALWQALREQFA